MSHFPLRIFSQATSLLNVRGCAFICMRLRNFAADPCRNDLQYLDYLSPKLIKQCAHQVYTLYCQWHWQIWRWLWSLTDRYVIESSPSHKSQNRMPNDWCIIEPLQHRTPLCRILQNIKIHSKRHGQISKIILVGIKTLLLKRCEGKCA